MKNLLVALVALASGCASITSFQYARPIGEGVTQFALEPSYLSSPGSTGTTLAAMSVRHGVSKSFEFGGRFGITGLELMSKISLLDGSNGVALALAPTVAGIGIGLPGAGAGFFSFNVPLLVGIPLGDHELVLGPRIYDVYTFAGDGGAGDAGANGLGVGLSFGLSLKVGENFRLLPEVSAVKPVAGVISLGGSSSSGSTSDGPWLYQLGVGVIFGK